MIGIGKTVMIEESDRLKIVDFATKLASAMGSNKAKVRLNDQIGCKHRYIESGQEKDGYHFKCIHCGKTIFGSLGEKNGNQRTN
jgi:uncharacterized protein CbrC (UPF0167 family)